MISPIRSDWLSSHFVLLSPRMLKTRADLLKYAIAHALRSACKVVRGARQGLPVGERELIGKEAATLIAALPDDPWKLAEPVPQNFDGISDMGCPTWASVSEPKS